MDVHEKPARAATTWVPDGLLRVAAVCAACLVIAVTVYLVAWLLVLVAPVSLAIVVALLLAALLGPVSEALHRFRVPAGLAALLTVLLLLVTLGLPMALVGHQVASQFGDLRTQLGEGMERVRTLLVGVLPVGERRVDELGREVAAAVSSALPGATTGLVAAVGTLGAAVLALVLLFLLLKDGYRLWQLTLALTPRRHRPRVDRAAGAGWDALTGYVRGTVVVAAVDAAGIGLVLVLLGVPLALPLAVLTFIAAFVPIVGATVAGGVAVLVTLVANGPVHALVILAAVILVQQLEGNVLEPLVMGRAVRLHPAVVLIAIATGTVLAGVAGALVAVPVTAVSYRVVRTLATGSDAPA